jgi:shikimate dehydrogenase
VLPLLDTVSDLARTSLRPTRWCCATACVPATTPTWRASSWRCARPASTGRRAVVLAAGATARSALAALQLLGDDAPTLVVRSEPTETLAAAGRLGLRPRVTAFAPQVLEGCDVLVSTLPAGAADPLAHHVAAVPVLLDVVYDPWPTALAAACTGVVVDGAAMLLHQAAAQVRLMTGHEPPVEAMRAALGRR